MMLDETVIGYTVYLYCHACRMTQLHYEDRPGRWRCANCGHIRGKPEGA